MELQINCLASIFAAGIAFVFGGIWYSKRVFGNLWIKESGAVMPVKPSHSAAVFVSAFVMMVIAACVTSFLIGMPRNFEHAVCIGIALGLGIATPVLGINYFFAGRSFKLFLIDSGFHVIQFAIYGVVLGWWH